MAWTYSGDPSESDLDYVRWLVGDTTSADQLAQDEEIEAAIARFGVLELAGAHVARGIAARFARLFDKAAGDVRKNLSQQAKNYKAIADELEASAAAARSITRQTAQLSNTFVW